VAKNLRIPESPFRGWVCFYSYGDSAGITPASLLTLVFNQGPITTAKVAAKFSELKNNFWFL
jgi:hypothetical protein